MTRVHLMRITITEAARIYRLPPRTIRHWITQGRLTATRTGRTWLINGPELEQLSDLRDTPSRRLPRPKALCASLRASEG